MAVSNATLVEFTTTLTTVVVLYSMYWLYFGVWKPSRLRNPVVVLIGTGLGGILLIYFPFLWSLGTFGSTLIVAGLTISGLVFTVYPPLILYILNSGITIRRGRANLQTLVLFTFILLFWAFPIYFIPSIPPNHGSRADQLIEVRPWDKKEVPVVIPHKEPSDEPTPDDSIPRHFPDS